MEKSQPFMEKFTCIIRYAALGSAGLCLCVILYVALVVLFPEVMATVIIGIPFSSELASFHLETIYWFIAGMFLLMRITLSLTVMYFLSMVMFPSHSLKAK